jgi:hypothetical protein
LALYLFAKCEIPISSIVLSCKSRVFSVVFCCIASASVEMADVLSGVLDDRVK